MKRGQKTSAEKAVLKLRQVEVQTARSKSLVLAAPLAAAQLKAGRSDQNA